MKKSLIWIAIGIVVVISLIIGGYFIFFRNGGEGIKGSGEVVKLALNIWPGYAHAFVAQEKGFFEKNGVNVELTLKEDYRDAQELYNDGEVDGILEVFSDTITHNLGGIDTKVVYVFDYSDAGDVIIGKGEYNYLSELKGKKIGVDGINTFSHIFVSTALEESGLKDSDYEIVNVPASDVLDALESGEIDAGHTWEPTRSTALKKGYKQLGKAGDYPGLITDVISFNSKVIEERPSDVQAIVKSLVEARAFVFSNKEEAIKIMAEAEGMSEEDMESGINGVHLLDLRDNKVAFSYAAGFESLHGTAKRINDFMIKQGITDKKLNSTEFIDARFIRGIE